MPRRQGECPWLDDRDGMGVRSKGLVTPEANSARFYWMFYDHFSARSLLAKLGRLIVLELMLELYIVLATNKSL